MGVGVSWASWGGRGGGERRMEESVGGVLLVGVGEGWGGGGLGWTTKKAMGTVRAGQATLRLYVKYGMAVSTHVEGELGPNVGL